MALPPTSVYRGIAAAIPAPVSGDNIHTLEENRQNIITYNSEWENIFYRESDNDVDIREAVYRWDERPYTEVFRTGFPPRQRGTTSLHDYYNLEVHVNDGGAPVDPTTAAGSIFVSTTRSTRWRPSIPTNLIIYRYEIFAPGGIDAVQTLGRENNFLTQQEIAFAGGIDRQYIRSARGYAVLGHQERFPAYAPYGNRIYRNGNFNPNPTENGYTSEDFMYNLRNPRCPNDGETMFNIVFTSHARKRDVQDGASHREEPYVDHCCKVGHHIECAFNTNYNLEEAFIFTADQGLQLNYAPGTTNDYIIKGPMNIDDLFPFLKDTIFATGIDAAFTAYATNEVYIFRSNIYALIDFYKGIIIGGPKKITDGFYSLKNTIFEHGIDAAFASSKKDEAYIFRGDKYALINFAPGTTNDYILTPPTRIALGFPYLAGTVFQNGLDAAFTVIGKNEAYIFKDDAYALINYARQTTDGLINSVTPISDGFKSLRGIIPRYPCGC